MASKKTKGNVLIFSAHSDDQVIGAGGAMFKLKESGYNVYNIIMCSGEKSHPWLKPEYILKLREEEALEAAKSLGCKKTIFLRLKDNKFLENKEGVLLEISELIKKYSPKRIYTHVQDDPHPDHAATNNLILEAVDRLGTENQKLKDELSIYAFDVWNPLNLRGRDLPRVYIDVTKYFDKKLDIFKTYRTQKIAILTLLGSVYLRAIVHGNHINTKYAERFYKLK